MFVPVRGKPWVFVDSYYLMFSKTHWPAGVADGGSSAVLMCLVDPPDSGYEFRMEAELLLTVTEDFETRLLSTTERRTSGSGGMATILALSTTLHCHLAGDFGRQAEPQSSSRYESPRCSERPTSGGCSASQRQQASFAVGPPTSRPMVDSVARPWADPRSRLRLVGPTYSGQAEFALIRLFPRLCASDLRS